MSIEAEYRASWRQKIECKSVEDPDSRLGTYIKVNSELKPFVPRPQKIMECERILLTRFQTCFHSLAIEIGRFSNINRKDRLCKTRRAIDVAHI